MFQRNPATHLFFWSWRRRKILAVWKSSGTRANHWFRCLWITSDREEEERCLKATVRGQQSLWGLYEMSQISFEAEASSNNEKYLIIISKEGNKTQFLFQKVSLSMSKSKREANSSQMQLEVRATAPCARLAESWLTFSCSIHKKIIEGQKVKKWMCSWLPGEHQQRFSPEATSTR